MSDFTDFLRQRMQEAQGAVIAAWRAGDEDRAFARAGELADLLEVAARNDVDTTGWVDPAVRSYANRWY
jgi:hypothetical protein